MRNALEAPTACQNLPSSGQCRELRFTSAPIHGCRLKNHVIRTIRVSNEDICEWQCYLEPNCVSYNFRNEKEANGEHKCDLNNATYEHDNEHAGDLVRNITYVYRGAEVNIRKICYCAYRRHAIKKSFDAIVFKNFRLIALLLRMLVQRNLARTKQPVRLVLQTEIINVCVFPDLRAVIVKTVGNTDSRNFSIMSFQCGS